MLSVAFMKHMEPNSPFDNQLLARRTMLLRPVSDLCPKRFYVKSLEVTVQYVSEHSTYRRGAM